MKCLNISTHPFTLINVLGTFETPLQLCMLDGSGTPCSHSIYTNMYTSLQACGFDRRVAHVFGLYADLGFFDTAYNFKILGSLAVADFAVSWYGLAGRCFYCYWSSELSSTSRWNWRYGHKIFHQGHHKQFPIYCCYHITGAVCIQQSACIAMVPILTPWNYSTDEQLICELLRKLSKAFLRHFMYFM